MHQGVRALRAASTFRAIHTLNNPEVRTPHLDSLANRGYAFTYCFHQGSWQPAVCVASQPDHWRWRGSHTYIVAPIDRLDGERRVNSAVLLDRCGKAVFIYDKVFPYWSEFDHKKKVDVGVAVPVYQADFGRIGFAICFDANFPEVWKSLAGQGTELVVSPSAYSAGTSLQAHALNNHFYIVSSTGAVDCIVYDITGKELLHQNSKDINIAQITLDLDRGIYHENFNLAKRDKLLRGMLTMSSSRNIWNARPGLFSAPAGPESVSAN